VRGRLLLILLAAAAALPAARLAAQSPDLARIDSLLDHSRFTAAHTALQQWLASSQAERKPDDVAHALMLRGRLTANADSAIAIYLELALGHPSSRYAPEAFLRIGQGYFALHRFQQAAAYLERITRDYPTFPQRALAADWLARARRQVGGAGAPEPSASQDDRLFTVQVGAFRDRNAALALARRLDDQDIPARVVVLTGGTLNLVRAGRFRTSAEATQLLGRVRQLVPGAIVADDAHHEVAASR